MNHYHASIELESRDVDADRVDILMELLADLHPSISVSPRGWLTVDVTVPAESLRQAASIAIPVVEAAAAAPPIVADVQLEREFDARSGFVPVPELIGVNDAAELLGVSPQRIHQMIDEHKLSAHRVGQRTVVLARHEVEAKRGI
jgi:excisionase family DNA binding protein